MVQCGECGKIIKETARMCPYCGISQDAREAESKNAVVLLVESAIQGNDLVWGEIYEKTHRYVYYLTLKTLRSEQDALDVAQEVYIQAMNSIGQLKNAGSFFAWLRSIIFSKCKDLMKKKSPMLLEDNDDGHSLLDEVQETDAEFLPEYVLDNAETRRMILELVDDLPYLQRQTVLYFYYDEMTVEQIAELMECAAGTVKSRLNYARQQIRKGVEEHERKGVKLYGAGVLPILTILLREQAGNLLIPPSLSGGIGAILGQASAATTAAASGATGSAAAATAVTTSAATATTTAAGMALAVKIVIGAVAATIVIGGGALLLTNNRDDTTPPPAPPLSVTDTEISNTTVQEALVDTNYGDTSPEDNLFYDTTEETPAEEPYYDTLSDGQKQVLSRLERALMALDYQTAYDMQLSSEYITILESIPANSPGSSGFTYYPDDETTIGIICNLQNGFSNSVYVFAGENGNGEFFLGRCENDGYYEYILNHAYYSGGKANGPFEYYFFASIDGETRFGTQNGNVMDSEPYGPVYSQITGWEENEDFDYPPEWYNWWPDWPDK